MPNATLQRDARFFETLEGVTADNVDEGNSVVRGVKVIGFKSKNRRTYTTESLRNAVSLYEGVTVFLDHPQKPNDARSVTEQFGNIRNARFVEGKGVFGDLHYNPAHSYAAPFVWEAKNNPGQVGLSHNASVRGKRLPGETVIESITGVRSVDLVADAATTRSLFESVNGEGEDGLLSESEYGFEGVIADKLRDDAAHRAFRQKVDAAKSLISRTIWNDELTLEAMTRHVVTIATDLISELNKPAQPATEGIDMSTDTNGRNFADMTLEEIRRARPELFDAQEQKEKFDALQKERDELKARVEKIELAEAVDAELKAAEFGEGQVSESFRALLLTMDGDQRKAAIADRKESFAATENTEGGNGGGKTGVVTKKPTTGKSGNVTEGVQPNGELSAVDFAGRLRSTSRIGGLQS